MYAHKCSYGFYDTTSSIIFGILFQAVNHFDDPSVGGLEGTMEKMTKADPDFGKY